MSGLKLAKGLAGDKRFVVIDSENGRASMYADYYDFDVTEISAPFSPDRYLEAIEAAEKAGYPVIVVDSFSHEWAGDGGCLDIQEAELDRMAGDDWKKREAVKMASWVKPKMMHKSMVARLLQLKAHVILCFRAESKIEMVKEGGKMVVRPKESLTGIEGFIPITEKNMPYELTASFLLTADKPGLPKPIKLQEAHKAFFPLNQQLSEDAGRLIGEWAKGGTPKVETALPPPRTSPITEVKPGVVEPVGQPPMLEDAAKWFTRIEQAPTMEALNQLGVDLARITLSEDDKTTARQLFAARKAQLKKQLQEMEI